MRLAVWLLGLFCTLLSTPAWADLTANYVAVNGAFTMKIEIASNGDVRGETSNPNSYFITRDGQVYLIQATFNGPAVMRMEDLAIVMAEQIKRTMPGTSFDDLKGMPLVELFKGGAVTVRGRRGMAYFMGKKASHGVNEKPTVVISTDPALAPLASAMRHQFEVANAGLGLMIGHSMPFGGILAPLKQGAPLIFFGMELDTVRSDPIPAARFVLPAEPLTLDGVRQNLGAPKP